MSISNKSVSCKKKSPRPTQIKIQKTISDSICTIKQVFCKKDLDQIAWDTEFIQRRSYIVGGKDFLVAMLLASLDSTHTSLEKISSILIRVNPNNRITAQSIMERINNPKTTNFFSKVLELFLKKRMPDWTKDIPPYLFSNFSKVLLQDSSVFELHEDLQDHFKGSGGRSSKSCLKIDVIYDLLSKQYEKFSITDQSEAESSLAANIESVLTKNSLVIRDLGYLRIDALEKIIQAKGYYLSRLKSNFQIFIDPNSETQINLIDCFGDEDLVDIPVYITKERLPVRLVAYKVPQEIIDKRKRLAHATAKKQGRTLSQNALKLMEFTIFITNVSPNYWDPKVLGTIYAIRWQIELLFKSWKTGMEIHYLKGINPNRIINLVYVRLILLMVLNKIYNLASYIGGEIGRIVSMPKVFAWMRDLERLIRILNGSLKSWEKKYFLDMISKSMCQQKRKRKTTLKAIYESVFYDEYYSLA